MKESGYCVDFYRSGRCESQIVRGYCGFSHDAKAEIYSGKATEAKPVERCRSCTLPLPCCAHAPKLGSTLCESCFLIKKAVDAEDDLLAGEIVAVIPRSKAEEMDSRPIYAVVDMDKKGIDRVVVTYLQNNKPTQSTLRRTHVFRLRQKLLIK